MCRAFENGNIIKLFNHVQKWYLSWFFIIICFVLYAVKKMSKFKEWVDAHNLDPKPSSFALEILSHLAYETVAQVIREIFKQLEV